MTGEELDEAEADAEQIQRLAGVIPEDGTRTRELAKKLGIGIVRSYSAQLARGREADIARVGSEWTIHLFERMRPERESWIIGHEIGHWLFRQRGKRPVGEERRCDAIGAALVAPKVAFQAALRKVGHRVHPLAQFFEAPQSLTLLRIGEVEDRPVLLFRSPTPIVRGAPFEWTTDPRSLPRSIAHPVRVDDGWGMMAERWAA